MANQMVKELKISDVSGYFRNIVLSVEKIFRIEQFLNSQNRWGLLEAEFESTIGYEKAAINKDNHFHRSRGKGKCVIL